MNINLTTPLNQLGYGIAGLNVLKALVRAGHEPALWVVGQGSCPLEDRPVVEAAVARAAAFDYRAPSLRISHQWDMAHRVGRGPHAGMTFFELNQLTAVEKHSLCSLDQVYVPSAWAAGVLAHNGVPAEKVCYAPLGVDPGIFSPSVAGGLPAHMEALEKSLRRDNATVFLACGKWEVRKGHDILADAFCKAFGRGENVALIANCSNPFLAAPQEAEWAAMYTKPSRGMHVVRERLPRQQDVARLMAFADCGVFPARSEGWNLELGEMLAMGKTCVATNYAGHTEFCTRENCLLVEPTGLEAAYDGVFFTSGHGEWAELGEASVEQLVEHMRVVHKKKQAGELAVNTAGVETFRHFTWDNTVVEMMSTLEKP